MDNGILPILIGVGFIALLFLIGMVIVFKVFLSGKTPLGPNASNWSSSWSVLVEKLSQVEDQQKTIAQTMNNLTVDLRGLSERMLSVENSQRSFDQGLGNLTTESLKAIAELKSMTDAISGTAQSMRSELTRAKEDLAALQAHVKTAQETERQVAESVRRLETVIAGTQSKGSAGENIIEQVFSKLPPDWQARNFILNNKPVEFALRLPNGLYLPIDSKWPATNLTEKFFQTDSEEERKKIKKEIQTATLNKAKEVQKYIDPNSTVNFAVAVVPDSVYDLCAEIQHETFALNVTLVSYSMFVPYLLLVFQTVLKSYQRIDLQKLEAFLQNTQDSLQSLLQEEIEGKLSKAINSLATSRDNLRAGIGRVNSNLTGLRPHADPAALSSAEHPALAPSTSSTHSD